MEWPQLLMFPSYSYNKLTKSPIFASKLTENLLRIKRPMAFENGQKQLVLGLDWFDFQLSSFSWVAMALPRIPVHPLPSLGVFAVMIKSVQIGENTVFVPPGSLVTCGTVPWVDVVVSIFGRERHATVIRKRVTSSSHKITHKRRYHSQIHQLFIKCEQRKS